jgi:hypothetical protein
VSGLPPSLSIALWLVGSTWAVAIVAHIGDAPREIVYASFLFGIVAGIAEWLVYKRSKR